MRQGPRSAFVMASPAREGRGEEMRRRRWTCSGTASRGRRRRQWERLPASLTPLSLVSVTRGATVFSFLPCPAASLPAPPYACRGKGPERLPEEWDQLVAINGRSRRRERQRQSVSSLRVMAKQGKGKGVSKACVTDWRPGVDAEQEPRKRQDSAPGLPWERRGPSLSIQSM